MIFLILIFPSPVSGIFFMNQGDKIRINHKIITHDSMIKVGNFWIYFFEYPISPENIKTHKMILVIPKVCIPQLGTTIFIIPHTSKYEKTQTKIHKNHINHGSEKYEKVRVASTARSKRREVTLIENATPIKIHIRKYVSILFFLSEKRVL